MREIELSAVRLEDVEFAYPLVGLNLPVSKKDPEGKGAKRTHRCACHLETGPAVCPYHVVKAQYDFAKGLAVAALRGADRGSRAWEKRPLCPAASGGAFTKRGFATALGQLVDAYESKEERLRRGKRRVKGHTPRRMGAQWLAKAGIPKHIIGTFARWGSEAIMGYIEEVAMEEACDSLSQAAIASAKLAKPQDQAAVAAEVDAGDAGAGGPEVGASTSASATRYVVNLSTGVAHIAKPDLYVRPVETWKSLCGMFKFGTKLDSVRVTEVAPADECLCRRCRSRSSA